ncbi:MAG: MFS transporter [Opitutales bacterium]|nr:MFS transporter [Opitutales bacterium]
MAVQKQENLLLSVGANIVVPALLLSKGKDWLPALEAWQILLLSLAFPFAYFFYDLWRRRTTNWISVLGFSGTLLTGGVGLFQLAPIWVAVKEACVPALIAVFFTLFPSERFLLNGQVFHIEKIEALCRERGTRERLSADLKRASYLTVAAFALSAVLNFCLARWIVVTDPAQDLEQFNVELGKMLALSWPVIVIPCMFFMILALCLAVRALRRATGENLENLLKK